MSVSRQLDVEYGINRPYLGLDNYTRPTHRCNFERPWTFL